MKRRAFLQLAASALPASLSGSAAVNPAPSVRTGIPDKPGLEEQSITDLQQGMKSGQLTSVQLVEGYQARIAALDLSGPKLRSVIELNPDAVKIARERDRERLAGRPCGPLHGIPVLLKDNIDTHDRMRTSAGSLALEHSQAPHDAFIVARLREAGAVVMGKTNLSEWANFRSTRSTSGWSGRGGLTRNPYVLDRNPSGSSSGSAVAVAASLCAAAVGTETDGSILSPSSYCGIVGIKPTVGLLSRRGIIPISRSQDTAGPMARTVTDAALLLAGLAGLDTTDPAVKEANYPDLDSFQPRLDGKALQGARIGVARQLFSSAPGVADVMESALSALREQGATLIDPVDRPDRGKLGNAEFEVMLYEFKAGLDAYLSALPPQVQVRSLQQLIEFNTENREHELCFFGQEILERAQAKGPLTEPDYQEALATCRRVMRTEGIDAVMDEHRLDALVAPTTGPAHVTDLIYGDRGTGGSTSPAAVAGYPSITVPAGWVRGLPVGLSLFGRAWSEPRLIALAYAFEQAHPVRRPPQFLPTVT